MTDAMMSHRSVVETAPDDDLLREMIGFSAELPMELEMGEVTGAAHGTQPRRPGAAHRRPRPCTRGS